MYLHSLEQDYILSVLKARDGGDGRDSDARDSGRRPGRLRRADDAHDGRGEVRPSLSRELLARLRGNLDGK